MKKIILTITMLAAIVHSSSFAKCLKIEKLTSQLKEQKAISEALKSFETRWNNELRQVKDGHPSAREITTLNEIFAGQVGISQYLDKEIKSLKSMNRCSTQTKLISHALKINAYFLIYNNYIKTFNHIEGNPSIRRSLNHEDSTYNRANRLFYRYMKLIGTFHKKHKIKQSIDYYTSHQNETLIPDSIKELWDNQSALIISNNTFFRANIDSVGVDALTRWGDEVFYLYEDVFSHWSTVIGKTVSAIKFREGFLQNRTDIMRDLEANLKPFDVILQSSPFKMTNMIIPGNFGHAQVWLGTEKQLRKYRMWSKLPEKYRRKVREGNYIVESIKEGVTLNNYKSLLNTDSIIILRNSSGADKLDEKLKTVLNQIGKEYDYAFNGNNAEALVCSELVLFLYPDFDYTLKTMMFLTTISPSSLAQDAISRKVPFEVILGYRNGNRLTGDSLKDWLDEIEEK